ncbi:precorrin-6y C5,15-methyltransferase (decarboxylating), CbiE subunit [Pirellula staleyi DSM 6068]|uniref:Precorrin-6y C5,15-methyltransferase (Decarboxylating), CbiE subunit n=1 Tax=Pirellula staleyi (strain ATCC 27377 / DSM 6068 / ICPB 4128) TaxID=530564 RepID=D2R988_PIRSD|nr:bifunctional cobalt-precorrin-7 (C(5))-methyltransferase/cobalt-precorrin-6B (C(15))-methyltransferase [Pirellula staleyi]ADB17638.1 precorrin-6y C5,15-methyltransferase (decarboxylating), CbiE subunit [Pirellula staleyi DSM 6068]
MEKVHILGIGDDGLEGLTQLARQKVLEAELLLGTRALLDAAASATGTKFEIAGDLEAVVKKLTDAHDKKVVILASGDPLFYGTARFLCEKLGKERFEVIPHVSSMQLAFARVKESWDDAYLASLSSQPVERVVEKTRTATTVGLFTTEQVPPRAVATALLDRKIDYFTAYVCENLGSPDECVTQGELAEVAETNFSPLNVMILVRKPDPPDRPQTMVGKKLFGNPDEAFLQSQPKRGLLTPAEVRSIALAEMDIGPASVIWDVGAGSGSVAIEAAQLASSGSSYAIEMDPEDFGLIGSNAERFAVTNLVPVLGKAPEAWQGLPAPDAIFVGGTGRQVSGIVEQAFDQLKRGGRLVANVGSIENLAAVRGVLVAKRAEVSVLMVNLARGTDQMETMRLESLNPTFLISARKS